MLLLIISKLHDILLLNFPIKMNIGMLKIGIEYKIRRILGEREILSKILGDYMRIWKTLEGVATLHIAIFYFFFFTNDRILLLPFELKIILLLSSPEQTSPPAMNFSKIFYPGHSNSNPPQLDSEKKSGSKFKNVSFFHINGKKEFFN